MKNPHRATSSRRLRQDDQGGFAPSLLLGVLFAGLLIAGCSLSPMGDGYTIEEEPACSSCHGDETTSASFEGLRGATETSELGVGAHSTHLVGGTVAQSVPCVSCHVVPESLADETLADETHVDSRPAEVMFSGLALADGAVPEWDRAGASCSQVYCHGPTLEGGAVTSPLWTVVDGSQMQCDSCHGNPPPSPHPVDTDCATCHPSVLESGAIDIAGGLHVDGHVDIADLPCESCHGDANSPAPPQDTLGNTDVASPGVGVHRAHLGVSDWHQEVQCTECHLYPDVVDTPGHLDSELPAELTWGPLATEGSTTPSYDATAHTCSETYCHGATLDPVGLVRTPTWTSDDGAAKACDACHGDPPSLPHPQDFSCDKCHPTLDPEKAFLEPETHINGVIDIGDLGCSTCHGDEDSSAPPLDVSGNGATTAPGVGAHREHLGPSDWHAEVLCEDCHVVPESLNDEGHVETQGVDDVLPAELTFSSKATDNGLLVSNYDYAAKTCSRVYCHGGTLPEGGHRPEWTKVDGTQAACDVCHGNPPGRTHVDNAQCEQCHEQVMATPDTFLAPELHIDGELQVTPPHDDAWVGANGLAGDHGAEFNAKGVDGCRGCHGDQLQLTAGSDTQTCDDCHAQYSADWRTDCVFCHGGTDNDTGAPPEGVDGETGSDVVQVGAHSMHVVDTSIHVAWDCDTCHVKPTDIMSPGHIDGDGVAEVTFSSLNADASEANGQCTNLYCHSDGWADTPLADPRQWTDTVSVICSSCHPDETNATKNTMSGSHFGHFNRGTTQCGHCHAGTMNLAGVFTNLSLHVNGTPEVSLSSGSWDGSSCSGTDAVDCHGGNTKVWR